MDSTLVSPVSFGSTGTSLCASPARQSSFWSQPVPASYLPTALSLLSGLISSNTRTIERAYSAQGLKVPSLDDATLNKIGTTSLAITPEVQKAIEVTVEACHQLIMVVQKPEVIIAEAALSSQISAALRLVVNAHISEILREHAKEGMHVDLIAEHANLDPHSLLRVLRLLVSHNIFLEKGGHGSAIFSNNRVSLALDSTELAASLKGKTTVAVDAPNEGLLALVLHSTDETYRQGIDLHSRIIPQAVKTPLPLASYSHESPSEQFSRHTRLLNAKGAASFLGSPPDLVRILKGIGNGLVVDLGSGLGKDLLPIVQAYPSIRLQMLDTPSNIEQAYQMWTRRYGRALGNQITLKGRDLLDTSMAYPRASTYLLRNYLCHLTDEEAHLVLSMARKAAFTQSKLYLEESTSDDELPFDVSNYLEARPELAEVLDETLMHVSHTPDRIQHLLDVQLLLRDGHGRKRTILSLVDLLEKSGWRTERIDGAGGGRCKMFIAKTLPMPQSDDEW